MERPKARLLFCFYSDHAVRLVVEWDFPDFGFIYAGFFCMFNFEPPQLVTLDFMIRGA